VLVLVRVLQRNRAYNNRKKKEREREREIVRHWLTHLLDLASGKSESRLGTLKIKHSFSLAT
jgi:hypothetical protein